MNTTPEQHDPLISVRGEKVGLGPLRRDLVPLYLRWVNDYEVFRTVSVPRPMTLEAETQWYDRASQNLDEPQFTIYVLDGLRPIGTCGLMHVDHFNRTAEFGIMIGEKDCWGKGYGTEVARLILDYGFTVLGLHNVFLRVHGYNERAIRAYRRAGFRETGRWREALRAGGRAHDMVLMDCLSTEFQGTLGATLWPPQEQ